MPRFDPDRYSRNFTPREARLAATPRGAELLAKLDAAKAAYNRATLRWHAYTRAPMGGRPKKWIGTTGRRLLEDVELFRISYARQIGEEPATAFILREFLKIGGVPEHSIGRKLKALEARYWEAQRHHGHYRVTAPADDGPIQRTTRAEWAEAVWAEEQWDALPDKFIRSIKRFVVMEVLGRNHGNHPN
jgi:hypothetical protein